MGGLLYKDFVSVRGKRFVCFLCIFTLIFILIRVMFPGDRFLDDFEAIAEDGSRINLIDIILEMFACIFIFMNMLFINRWTMEICGSDENNKIRSFFAAMPYEKHTYIASKYVFILIAAYVFFSLSQIWIISCGAFMSEGKAMDTLMTVNAMMLPFYSLTIFVSAIELFLFLVFGKGRAMMIKVGFLLLLALCVIYIFLFKDYSAMLDKINIFSIVQWMEKNSFFLTLLQVLSPVITLLCYWGSYRLCCLCCSGKEKDYD